MKRAGTHIFMSAVTAMLAIFVTLRAETASPQQPPEVKPQEYHSVWEGVYTEKQAARGEALYRSECSTCHGDKLTGKESENAPALTGPDFATQWKDRTVADLFRKILKKMPQDDPGTLTPQQSVDLVAFLLSFNKFPAGKTELPPENDPLAAIHFDDQKPEQK